MTWIAGGVFTTKLHLVADNAPSMRVNQRRYWWSVCNHACVPIPPEHDLEAAGWPWCRTCFPDMAAIEAALRTRPTAPQRTTPWPTPPAPAATTTASAPTTSATRPGPPWSGSTYEPS